MSKYQEYYERMIRLNKEQFNKFLSIHDKFMQDPAAFREEFNREGSEITDIIREWENKLCNYSEGGQFGKFSSTLADKFWELVRKDFPRIDDVGLK